MARNLDQYTILINADATRAKKEIADLLKSLKAVGTMNLDKLGLDTLIREASVAADELAIHLKNATNANTGKLNLVEFNKSIQASGRSMSQLITTLAQGGNVGQLAFRQLTAAIANTQVPIKLTNTLLNNMMTTLKNTVKWELSSAAVHSLESALSGAVSYVEDLNTSLTNIRIVTNKSAEDMALFAILANKAAKELSSTTKAYTDASLIYFQQGDSEEMAAKKAAITLKAAHSSFNSTASEMSEYLTAVWNSYKVSGDELQRYVDIMAALGANTATSLEEIATSMLKVAATANTVGVSMEQVSSIIATVSSVTRESAESIGTSYKTIFARIGDLKLGKTDEDGIGLGTVSSLLLAIGVDILDLNLNLREMGDIITDLGNRWQTMTSAQKTATAQAVAGKRQYTQLMALFENWDMYGANLATAMNSEGTLELMNSMYEEGLKAALDRARASMESLYSALLDEKILKLFANATATIADNIANVVEALGGLGGIATSVGGLLLLVFSKKLGSLIKEVSLGIVDFVKGNSTYKLQYLKTFEDTKKDLSSQTIQTLAIKQTQNMLSLKLKLLEVEDSLTAKLAEYMQSAITSYGELISKLNELEQEYLNTEKTIKSLTASMLMFANVKSPNGHSFESYLNSYITNKGKFLGSTDGLNENYSLITNTKFTKGQYTSDFINILGQALKINYVGTNLLTYLTEDKIQQLTSGTEQSFLPLVRLILNLSELVDGTRLSKLFDGFKEQSTLTEAELRDLRTNVNTLVDSTLLDANKVALILYDTLGKLPEGALKNNLTSILGKIEIKTTETGELFMVFKTLLSETEAQAVRLTSTLNSMLTGFNSLMNGVGKVIGTITGLTMSYNTLSNATKNLSLNSGNLISNIGSIAMGLGSLIPVLLNVFTWGKGISEVIGGMAWLAPTLTAVVAVLSIAGSVYSGVKQAEKETYLKDQTERDEKRKELVSKKDEELSNIQSLIKNYNTLKETYDATGEGLDALAASARALAEAYGLVGANVLIAEGNFKEFENMVAKSSGLDVLINFYQEKIDEAKAELEDTSKNSKYYDGGLLSYNSQDLVSPEYETNEEGEIKYTGHYTRDYYDQSAVLFSQDQLDKLNINPEDLIGDYHLDTIYAAELALSNYNNLFSEFDSMSALVRRAKEQGLGNGSSINKFSTSLGKHVRNFQDDIISLNSETYQDILMEELYKYFDPEIFKMFQGDYDGDEAPSHLLAKFLDMIQTDEDGNLYIYESLLDEFLDATKDLKLLWLLDFSDWGLEKVKELELQIFLNDTNYQAKYDEAINERAQALKDAKEGELQAYIDEAYKQYEEIVGNSFDYNYFDSLVNDLGLISYNDEGIDKFAWYLNYLLLKKAANAELEKVKSILDSGKYEEDSLIYAILQGRLENLLVMVEDLNNLENKSLTELVENISVYEASSAKVKLINEAMTDLLGKSEANKEVDFKIFSDAMDKVKSGIDASAGSYEELQKYLIADASSATGFAMNEDGTYQIKEGLRDSYEIARDSIAAGFISDLTSFDDYLFIYQDLAALFKDLKFIDAKNYVNYKEIKDAREVNGRFLHALLRDFRDETFSADEEGIFEATNADAVLAYNRQKIKASDAQQSYNTINSLTSSYKEKLSLDDAISLLLSLGDLIEDGDDAWSKFIQMDYDGRKAYLEARRDVYLLNVKTLQETVKEQAEGERNKLTGQIEEAFKDYDIDTLYSDDGKIDISKLSSMFYYNKDSKIYSFNGKDLDEDLYELMSGLLSDYSNNELDIQNADSIIAAILLMTSQTASLTTQISTMAQEFENFNKTGKVSANLLRQMAEWGIDSRQIKNTKSYLEVMKLIADKAKTQSSQKKTTYETALAESKIKTDIEAQGWTDELKKKNPELYALYDEWMQSRITAEETENQYTQTRQIYLDLEITKNEKLLSQMKQRKALAEEEAKKTSTLALAMDSAINSGILTNAQRTGADAELLAMWDGAADATERATVAAYAWNKYATLITLAGEETKTAYENASTSLDRLINQGKKIKVLDLYGYNFGDLTNGKQDFSNWITELNIADDFKLIWIDAFKEASKTTNFSGMSDIEILEVVKALIIKTGQITGEELDKVLATVKDNISNIFETLTLYNIDAAQKAALAWLDAFNTIKNARLSLLSGGSILDQIAGNPKAIYLLMEATGLEANLIYQMAFANDTAGLLKATNGYLTNNRDSYLNDLLASYGLSNNFGLNGDILRDVESLGYIRNKDGRWVDSNGKLVSDKTDALENDRDAAKKILEHLIAQYSLVLRNLDDTLSKELADSLAEKIFGGDTEAYSLLTESALKFANAVNASVDALDASTKLQEALAAVLYQSNPNNLPQEKLDKISVNGKNAKDYEEYQKLQLAIDRAQQAKYKGESWESLSESDRDILSLFGIDFSNVDTAATECATALAACAKAAYQLALAAAEDKGYKQEDGIWKKKNENGEYVEIANPQSDPVILAIELAGEASKSAAASVVDTDYQTFERMASSVDMTTNEFKQFTEAMKEAGEITAKTTEGQYELARSLARIQKGLKTNRDSMKEWQKSLKKSKDDMILHNKTLSEMRKSFEDILDMPTGSLNDLSEEFMTSSKTAELLKKAMKGDEEAYNNLLAAVAEEMLIGKNVEISPNLKEAINTIATEMDNLPVNEPILLGELAQVSPALYNALNEYLASILRTGEDVLAAAEALGFDLEYTTQTIPVEAAGIAYEPGKTFTTKDGTFTTVKASVNKDGTTLTVTAIKAITNKGTRGGHIGGSHPKSSGGGGNKKKETKEHKRYQDEIERYHKNNETLSRVSELLDKIEKQKERVYGAKYIDRIDEETEALKRQLEAQQALYDEASKYIAADKVDVARYGATFDQDGTIVNYEEVMRNIIDEYNRAIDVYNNSDQEEGAKKALEAAEERYNDAKKSIENYEEAILKANEAENNMLETKNKLSAAEVEKITYKLEFKLEMNERDLALLEYYQDKYAELLDKQDDLFASYFDAAAEYELNLNAIGEAYNSLVSKYAAGLITEKDYAEQLEELHDKALDNLKSLNEVEENLIDSYTQALELAQEQVEKTTSSIESANETLQSYMDILNLYEGATDYKKMANFYDMMNKNNITNIEVQKKHLDVLLAEEDKFQEKIRNGQELTELEKKEYEALEEQILDTRETLLSTTLEALETIRSTYENTINGIADDLDNFMAGSAGSLSYLQELYELFQEEQEQYVSTTKELYEVSKLNRDIEGSIADATSKASKEALKALQEKINKQSELNQLTEYDLQMNQLEYQLLLARINLEETKNAKDVVRLTRDDNGNYAYRYTANQDKIDEAAQKYEDVLQQINELTVNRISDTEQKLVNAMANYKEKFVEIATDYTLTEEERLMKLEELTNNFSKNMQYIQEQNLIATDNLATNLEMIADYYGASMSEITSSTAGNVNDNILSMMNKTLEYVEYMNNAIYGKDGWQTAWKEYIAGLGNIKESSGQAYEDMMNNALEMGEMNDFSAEQAENVLNVLEDTLEPLTNLTEAWNAHNAILNNTIETYENLAQVILGTLAAIGQIPNTVGAGDAKTTIDGKAYARGGLVDYTGLAWVDGTPDDPELMLNAGDTQNILAAASVASSLDKGILRTLMESVSTTAQAMLGMLSNAYHAVGISPVSSTTLDQQVHITAEFPNVTDHNEIEEALSTLVNRAAQFANHK